MFNKMILSPEMELNRSKAARQLLLLSAFCFPLLSAGAYLIGNPVLPIAIGSLGSLALGLSLSRLEPAIARVGAALALVGQSLVMVSVFAGHPWQMDSHLMILAALVCCAGLVDVRAIIVPSVFICLHHVGLWLVAPALAFEGIDAALNFERLILHAGAVGATAGVLALLTVDRLNGSALSYAQQSAAEEAAEAARIAGEEATLARTQAEQDRQDAIAARHAAEVAAERIERETAARLTVEQEARALQAEAMRVAESDRDEKDRAISALREGLNALANGDLKMQLTADLGKDYADLRRDFNCAVSALHHAFAEIRSNTDMIRGETDDIATSAADLSQRTERQALTLEALAGSMNQLSGLIGSAASDAKKAEAVVLTTRSEAQNGSIVMTRAISAMGEIESTSSEVRKISGVIDDIAFQTNLLALNAGVEAARAGSAGRGFAVVASEVRALARRSSEAARKINALIGQSASQIRDGVTLVRETGEALEQIIESVSEASERMVQIAATSTNQAEGVAQINDALRDLDLVAQSNAAMFEETTAACQTLKGSAQALANSLQSFARGEEALPPPVVSGRATAA